MGLLLTMACVLDSHQWLNIRQAFQSHLCGPSSSRNLSFSIPTISQLSLHIWHASRISTSSLNIDIWTVFSARRRRRDASSLWLESRPQLHLYSSRVRRPNGAIPPPSHLATPDSGHGSTGQSLLCHHRRRMGRVVTIFCDSQMIRVWILQRLVPVRVASSFKYHMQTYE